MKKNFRNRLMAVTAAAASSFLLLSGFDSATTVQDIMTNSQAAMAAANSMSAEFQGNADLSFDMSLGGETQSLAMTGNANAVVQYSLDPFVIGVTGGATGDAAAFGLAGDVTFDFYVAAQEDGSGIMYAHIPAMGDDQWHAASVSAEDLTMVKDAIVSSRSGDISAAVGQTGIDVASIQEAVNSSMTVSETPATVDGIECYEVTSVISGDTLSELISQILAAVPQAGIDDSVTMILQMILSGIQIDVTNHYAADTFAPVACVVDLGNSDFSTIGQLIGAMMMSGASDESTEMPEINLNVNALNLTVFFHELTAPIEIPAEALAAEVESAVSAADVTNMAQSAAESAGTVAQ